ncbi:hypothetical protein [Nocardia jiangsuensis]|uniref:2-phosphosulfolactate phosphatase n=1 Tax=Nocardia jiangsuensis TaxID=1691563 RepID=A0ABV8DSB2_9NOCA
MNPEHRQGEYRARFDWGLVGAEAVRADVTVVVDVLSFTTTLSVAADLGIEVFPYRWGHGGVAGYAAARGAVGAVGRRVAGPGQGEIGAALRGCASGRELIAAGFAEDVGIAGEVGVSSVVPVLDGERFVSTVPGRGWPPGSGATPRG